MANKKVKGFIRRKDKQGRNVVFVRDWCITDEERKEVIDLQNFGYIVKKAKKHEEKEVEKHEVTEKFDIHYDTVRKADMIEYVTKFVKDEEKIKNWATASHKTKGEKKVFSQIASKKAFFQIFFPERWEKEILPMLESRKFKKGEEKKEKDFFAKYLG